MKGVLIHPTILKSLNKYLHTLDIIALFQLDRWTYYEWAFKFYIEVCFELDRRFWERYNCLQFYCDENIINGYRRVMRDAYHDTSCVYCGRDSSFNCFIDFDIRPHTTCEQCYMKDDTISWICIEWDSNKRLDGTKRSKWIRFWKRYFLRHGKPYLQCLNASERWRFLQISDKEYCKTCYKIFKLTF